MQIPEEIKQSVYNLQSKNGRISPHWKNKIEDTLLTFLTNNSLTLVQLKYFIENELNEIPRCKTCGNILVHFERGISFCSEKCSSSHIDVQNKIKNTNVKKYGVECVFQSEEIKETIRETCKEKYGAENPFQSEEIKNKIKQINLERYGVENPSQSDVIKEKASKTKLEKYGSETYNNIEKMQKTKLEKYGSENFVNLDKAKETCLNKYGAENPFQSTEIKEKIKRTNLERYGVEHPGQSIVCKEKAKKTNLEKYGVEHSFQSCIIQEKAKKTNLEKYGCENTFQAEQFKEKASKTKLEKYGSETYNNREKAKETCLDRYDAESFNNREKAKDTCLEKYGVEHHMLMDDIKSKIIRSHRKNYISLFLKKLDIKNIELNTSIEDYKNGIKQLDCTCKICHTTFTSNSANPQKINCPNCLRIGTSTGENQVYEYIKSILPENTQIIKQDRTVLFGKELDILIPEKKLAIEFDGIYWHSELFKDRLYHKSKTVECEKQGIQLIHITDYDWTTKQDIIKSLLKSKLGFYDTIIHGRKCIIKDLSSFEYKEFLNENHIQGEMNSLYKYGLFFETECVAVIGLGKNRFSKDEIEIQRFCTKKYTKVHGALSKLLKHFINETKTENIISYIDRRYFNGSGYIKSGFTIVATTEPSYEYIVNGTPENRMKYQKHKLQNILTLFDENLSEHENMLINNFYRLYDCGVTKVEYRNGEK